jgi:hypothetical protein
MVNGITALCFACVVLQGLVCPALARQPESASLARQQPQVKQPLSEQGLQQLIDKEKAALDARERRIDAELKSLDRMALKDDDWAKQWAGSYYTGDGLGMNVLIKIAPKGGLTYTWNGCMGLYDANHGDVVETFRDGFRLKLAIDESASIYRFLSSRVYFVKWGDRRYLVPESQMIKLVNNFNEGGLGRSMMIGMPLKFEGEVHRRWGDEAPAGRPELPERFASLIVEKGAELKVVKVESRPVRNVTGNVDVSESLLELSGGTEQGVFVGMELKYQRGNSFGSVKITRVDAKTSTGSLTIFFSQGEKPLLPEVGAQLSLPGSAQKVNLAPEKTVKK